MNPTAPQATDQATRQGRDMLAHHASGAAAIRHRLEELDAEWSVERVIEAKAAGLTLAGVALAASVDRRFLALPALAGVMLIHQAVFGPALYASMARRMGFRTCREIDRERSALKALRGDFREVTAGDATGTQRFDRAFAAAGR